MKNGIRKTARLARQAASRLAGRRIPLFVQLMTTERCNLSCRYCYAEFGGRRRPDFPLEPLLQVIDGLGRLGCAFVMLAGGEPMLRKDIGAVISRVKAAGMNCSLNTNGLLIPERIEEIAGTDLLSISLDGPPDIHDYYRGEGTYRKVIGAIEAGRRRGIRVQLQFTLTRDLAQAFAHVDSVAREYGCFIGINFLRPQDKIEGVRVEAAEASDEEIGAFLDDLIGHPRRVLPYPKHILRYVRRWPYGFGRHLITDREDLKSFRPIPCQSGRYLAAIDNRGDIFPCTKLFYSEPLGNCLDGDIEGAWLRLKPVNCQACLDLGCNLINDLLRFHPFALAGLLRNWHPRVRRPAGR